MESEGQNKIRKRLVIACDGTWMNSDSAFEKDSWLPWNKHGHLQNPTNVTRICRAIRPESSEGIPQIVYYQAGVGASNSIWDHFIGGGTGAGLSEHIREGYAFLANNYARGDEVFIFGFSRGAFTARSIAGLITAVGLLTKKGLKEFYPIFKDWENEITPGYQSPWPDRPFPNKPKITDPGYTVGLQQHGLSRLDIPIRAVGVWETVGSLGVPTLGFMPRFISNREYTFVDTKVGSNVEYAFQALALDEHRKSYSPTIWEKPDDQELPRILKQCWFPGAHANIGGSYDDTEIEDISLAWMISQVDKLLEFDPNYICNQRRQNVEYYRKNSVPVRPWALGEVFDEMKGLMLLGGSAVRTPGVYNTTNPITGITTSCPLKNTHEFIHSCVRNRIKLRGKGLEDKGIYEPAAMKGWKLLNPKREPEDGKPQIRDESETINQRGYSWALGDRPDALVILEDELGDQELKLKGME